MKKFIIITTVLLSMMACSKNDDAFIDDTDGTSFQAGQLVTISAGIPTEGTQSPDTKVSSDASGNPITFKWEKDDKILVKVGNKSAEFTLSSGIGSAQATFTGNMPASGNTFDMQYPVDDDISLLNQDHNGGSSLPNCMLFTATNCTLNTPSDLAPQYAVIQLKFYGTKKIESIWISDSNGVYTAGLSCGEEGAEISNDENNPTSFYIITEPFNDNLRIKVVEPNDNETSFSTSSTKNVKAGECLVMPTKQFGESNNSFTLESKSNTTQKVNDISGWLGINLLGSKECSPGTTMSDYFNELIPESYSESLTIADNYIKISYNSASIFLPCDTDSEITDGATYTWQSYVPK